MYSDDFVRDPNGNEIDLLHVSGKSLAGIEIKSSATYHQSFKKPLERFHERITPWQIRYFIYNGDDHAFSDGIDVLNFRNTCTVVK